MKQVVIHAVELRNAPTNDEKTEIKNEYHITLCSNIEKQIIKYNLWGKLY